MSQIPKSLSITTQKPAEAADDKQQERRGLLERLGDKILQRLGKTTGADGEVYFSPESVAPRLLPVAGGGAQPIPLQQTRTSRAATSSQPKSLHRGIVNPSGLPSERSNQSKVSASPSQTRMPYISKVNRRVPPALVPGLFNSENATLPKNETSGKVATTNVAPVSSSLIKQMPAQGSRAALDSTSVAPRPATNRVRSETIEKATPSRMMPKSQSLKPIRSERKSLRVCFLEDSCTSSHAIREALQSHHHVVDHFSSAEEAVDAVMEKPYDVILASQIVALGGMDCVGLIRTVRSCANPLKRSLPLVVITANTDPNNLESFYVVGASEVVVKPIEGLELIERLVRTVDRSMAPSDAPKKRLPAQRLKICFLEDSCTSSHAIREALGERGHEVDHFSAAEEAFDALMEKRYDAVLASQIVSVGGMDCEALVRKIRHAASVEKRVLPILAITANTDPANIQRFFAAGANDVVLKPVEGLELDERIQSTVRARRAATPQKTQTMRETAPPSPVISPPNARTTQQGMTPIREAAPKTAPAARSRRLKVCFLEDSCTSSHAIREALGDGGHEVDHFSIYEEALDAFYEKDYQILLVSQSLEVSGPKAIPNLIRHIRSSKDVRRRNTPIVVLTTDGSLENRHAVMSVGANDLVVKPVQGNLGEYLVHVADSAVRALAVPDRSQALPSPRPDTIARRVPNRLRVCFLEDSCTSSHAIREMLGEAGHEVDHFSSPEEALDALHEKPYDVLLASQIVALGGLDCVSLIEKVRNGTTAEKRTIGIVAITANPEPANLQSFRNAGADAVIVKPIEGNLSERIKNILRTRPVGGSRPRNAALPIANSLPTPARRVVQSSNAAPSSAAAPNGPRPELSRALGNLNARAEQSSGIPKQGGSTRRDQATSSGNTPAARAKPETQPRPHTQQPGRASVSRTNTTAHSTASSAAPPALHIPATAIPRYGVARRKKSSASSLVYVVALAAVIAIVATSWHHLAGDVAVVSVARVEFGEIYQTIPASGRVVSKRKVEITAPAPGQITHVYVREGDVVRKDQVLAALDRRDADITLQRAEAQLESAKKDVALAQRTLDRLIRALQMGAVSRQMAEDAEAALHAAQARQRVSAEEVKSARLASTRTEIKAPFAGTVLSASAVEGAWTEPPTPLFSVVNMNEREVEIRTEATNSASIDVGQKVLLRSDAFPDRQWLEEVIRIAPGTARDANSGISNSVSIYVSLSKKAPELLFGQQVDAEVRLASTMRALKVPFSALSNQDGKTMVAILDAGRVHFVPVVTGLESATHVQIKDGVKRGQRIILNSRNLKEGQKVEIAELTT